MCEAEFAQIALEIEDFASLPRALGGLGVGILNAADDLAGGGAAVARGARQASRELKPVVIGENMNRVTQYAGERYLTIKNFVPDEAFQAAFAKGLEAALALNRQWIVQMMRQGRLIIDIGPEFPARRAGHPYRPSVFYELERRLLKGYSQYRKVFLRKGSYGGVPELDPDSEFWWR